jgi:hypothetical protein
LFAKNAKHFSYRKQKNVFNLFALYAMPKNCVKWLMGLDMKIILPQNYSSLHAILGVGT